MAELRHLLTPHESQGWISKIKLLVLSVLFGEVCRVVRRSKK
jgi:hypothetical protein